MVSSSQLCSEREGETEAGGEMPFSAWLLSTFPLPQGAVAAGPAASPPSACRAAASRSDANSLGQGKKRPVSF